MNANRFVLPAIVVGVLLCLFGSVNKAVADTITLDKVTQVEGHEIQGNGTYTTGGGATIITMIVTDQNNKKVSSSIGVKGGSGNVTVQPAGSSLGAGRPWRWAVSAAWR